MDDEQKRLAEEVLFSEHKPMGFAKKLFFGEYAGKDITPFPKLRGEEAQQAEAFIQKVRDFADKEIDPDAIDRNAQIPESVIQGLARIGVLGMTVPKEYGGLGMSQRAYCKVTEEIARRCGSTALFINVHQSIGLKALLLFGTPAQRQEWLRPLAEGKLKAAFSLTEPNAGSDAGGIETKAVYDPQKKVYRINGKKQWTTSGSLADVITLMAKTEVQTPKGPQEKVTAFLISPKMPGFKILNPGLEKVGMRGTRTTNLQFTDMEVPESNILGSLGAGLKVCLTILDYGRTTFGSTCTGSSKYLLERAIAHAKSRFQFKRPLGSFALVKKKIATMAALTYAMDATTELTAAMVDMGVEDIMLEAAILKVFASDAQWQILYDTMQIFGGRSFFTDEPFERIMRDSRLNMIGEGSNEVLRAFIGVVGLRDIGMQLKGVVEDAKTTTGLWPSIKWSFTDLARRFGRVKVPVNSKELKTEARVLGSGIRRFGGYVVALLARYGEDVIERQLALDRIATSAIALFTTSAVLSKIDTDLTDGTAKPHDLETAQYYCRMAMRTLHDQLDNLFDSQDKRTEHLSDAITGIKPF